MAVLTILILSSSIAHAESLEGNAAVLKESVRYNDLNLADMSGIRTLYGRIERAAMHVCEEYHDGTTDLAHKAIINNCKTIAVRQAVLQVGNAALIRYYETRAGQLPTLALL